MMLWMDDVQAELLLEDIEVAIAMQQRMVVADAVRRNQQIDGLADGAAGIAKEPIMLRCIDRQLDVMELEDLEFVKLGVDERRLAVIAKSL